MTVFDDLMRYLILHKSPGDTVTLTVLRGDQKLDIRLTLGTARRNKLQLSAISYWHLAVNAGSAWSRNENIECWRREAAHTLFI